MMISLLEQELKQRLNGIELRIQAACDRAGRDRASVQLIAVTKTVTADVAACLADLGVQHMGENRPQELQRKVLALRKHGITWHMIGHLQRNKVADVLPLVQRIHSVDSQRLLTEIAKEAKKQQRTPEILLQINGSREESKFGLNYTDIPQLQIPENVRICGWMTMAAYTDNPEEARATFRELKTFARQYPYPELSMGMSGDFEAAIEEGATWIRVGSSLFEGLPGIPE